MILDASAPDRWPVDAADAVVAINMIHISPWSSCQGLLAGAGRMLPPGGVLVLYGPFIESGVETAPSNLKFDDWLKDKDPSFGIRDLHRVGAEAARHGLALTERIAMPANNLSVVFTKAQARAGP